MMVQSIDTKAIAEKYGLSTATVETLLAGLMATSGRQVQFSLPELGGMGQWMPGMVMVGRMGDYALKARVDALCIELAGLIATSSSPTTSAPQTPSFPPMHFSSPSSATAAGSQNGSRYTYHASTNRLTIEHAGQIETYDTTGHAITGVSQAQTNAMPGTLRFTTADGGTVDLMSLKRVE